MKNIYEKSLHVRSKPQSFSRTAWQPWTAVQGRPGWFVHTMYIPCSLRTFLVPSISRYIPGTKLTGIPGYEDTCTMYVHMYQSIDLAQERPIVAVSIEARGVDSHHQTSPSLLNTFSSLPYLIGKVASAVTRPTNAAPTFQFHRQIGWDKERPTLTGKIRPNVMYATARLPHLR